LFELLDPQSLEPARASLVSLGQAMTQSTALRHLAASPAFRADEKLAVLSALAERLHAPPLLKSFLGVLVAKHRIRFLPEIADAFATLADQAKGASRVTVLSAVALSAAEQARVRSRLHNLLNRDVDVTFQTEPRLLGGLQIRIGSRLYDSSVRSRLNAMQTMLIKE
jgi:F-type H+-transporting ATPase subunit delta